MTKKGIMWAQAVYPILAIFIVVVGAGVGFHMFDRTADITQPIINRSGSDDFQIIHDREYLQENDKVALSSFRALTYAINSLAKGEHVGQNVVRDSENILEIFDGEYLIDSVELRAFVTFEGEFDYTYQARGGSFTSSQASTRRIEDIIVIDNVLESEFLRTNELYARINDFETKLEENARTSRRFTSTREHRITEIRTINFEVMVKYENVNDETIITRTLTTRDDNSDIQIPLTTELGFRGNELRGIDLSAGETCDLAINNMIFPGFSIYYCGKGIDFVLFQIEEHSQDEFERNQGVDHTNFRYYSTVRNLVGLIPFVSRSVAPSRSVESLTCANGIDIEGLCVECDDTQCIIKGFELPQDVSRETAEGRIAGYGDPAFLIYYQQFPQGEDAAWQLSEISAWKQSALLGTVLSGLTMGGGRLVYQGGRLAVNVARASAHPIRTLRQTPDALSRIVSARLLQNGVNNIGRVATGMVDRSRTILQQLNTASRQRAITKASERVPQQTEFLFDSVESTLRLPATNALQQSAAQANQQGVLNLITSSPAFTIGTNTQIVYTTALFLTTLYEQSVLRKFEPAGINSMVIRQPEFADHVSIVDGHEEYSLHESARQFALLLTKHERDNANMINMFFASPCKADIIIEKTTCRCDASATVQSEEQVFTLREQVTDSPYLIPTIGVVDTDENLLIMQELSSRSSGVTSQRGNTLISSVGGDDSFAVTECRDMGWWGNVRNRPTTSAQCIVVYVDKSSYGDYNNGFNFCHQVNPRSRGVVVGATTIAVTSISFVATGVTSLVVGGATFGFGGIAAYMVVGGATAAGSQAIIDFVERQYKWPRGD